MTKHVEYITEGNFIADLGCGKGAPWWEIAPASCTIDAYDFVPVVTRQPNIHFHRADVQFLYLRKDIFEKYDFAACDHVFEHVEKPEMLAASLSHMIKLGGIVHVGIPDASFFTDRFYRMLLRGGGHVYKHTKDSFIKLAEQFGFLVLDVWEWLNDWKWLKFMSPDLVGMNDPEEIQFVADVFTKELTPERGYYYGWGFILKKDKHVNLEYLGIEFAVEAPTITKLHPNTAKLGKGFNVQPSGCSAISAEVQNVTYSTIMLFDDMALESHFDGSNIVSALVPEELLIKAGRHEVCLYDHTTCLKSNTMSFEIC